MSNFKEMLSEVLFEKGMTFTDLENAGIIPARTFYQYETLTPYLPTIIKICNFLKVSMDYLANRTTENNFKAYKSQQANFYELLTRKLKSLKISQNKISKETGLGRANFIYWQRGKQPKFNTLIVLADYISCNIDDFLERE